MSFSRSVLPSLLGRDWWDLWDFPTHMGDQHFGRGISLLEPTPHVHRYVRPRQWASRGQSGLSEVKNDPEQFNIQLDVSHFSPEEITVKTVNNCIVINGKHEERADEHGFISREFTRRYMLPNEVEPETVTSTLTHDGVLTIQAPKKRLAPPPSNERVVPIVMTSAKNTEQGAGDGQKSERKD